MPYDYNLFGEDDPFKFDFGLNSKPNSFQTPDTTSYARNRLPGLNAPVYDYGPMQRYQKYLSSEPDRGDFKPSILRRILAGASGGFEAMDSGNIGRGIQLGQGILNQPYEQAYDQWAQRGNRVKADAALADTRFKNEMTAYDKQVDNALRERTIANSERGTDLRAQEIDLRLKQFESGGWGFDTDSEGNVVARRVNPSTGQTEVQNTGMKSNELTMNDRTALQKMNNDAARERANIRERGAFSRLLTSQDRQDKRQSRAESHDRTMVGMRGALAEFNKGTEAPTVATPANTSTASGLIKNKYPELNVPELVDAIRVQGNRISLGYNIDDPADAEELRTKILQAAKGDRSKAAQLLQKWILLDNDVDSFYPDEEEEQ